MAQSTRQAAITEALANVKLFDTHEHLVPEAVRLSLQLDFTYLIPHYLSSDLVSAGMPGDQLEAIRTPGREMSEALRWQFHRRRPVYPFPERLPASELPLEEKWRRFAPYWAKVRNTGYSRAILIAIHDLFGFDDLNEMTYRPLSEALQATNHPGWYRHVLKERAGIEISVEDFGSVDIDRDLYLPSVRFDRFVEIEDQLSLRTLEHDTGISITCVGDLIRAFEFDMARKKDQGMVAVKTGLAYQRIISYGEATRHDAEQAFNRLFRHPLERLSWEEGKPLQDYMMHQVLARATELGLPIQVHTGLQEGNANVVSNSNPTLLTPLFMRYPRARFDLFHSGYPYSSEMAAIAKNFPNVYADMCWMYIISPTKAAAILHEWLEVIPVNKIFGFGGDFILPEGAYGHSRMARQVISRVLAEKVEGGYFSEKEALAFGQMILHDNACALFCG